MTDKRFLVPVLTLLAFGATARAQSQEYCSGTNLACTTYSQTAFNTALSADDPSGLLDFSNSLGVLSGYAYTDNLTDIAFVDYLAGSPGGAFSYAGSGLASPVTLGSYYIQLTIPANYLAVALDINIPRGLCGNYCTEDQTTGFVGFINTGDPSLPWTISVGPAAGGEVTEIVNFEAYGAPAEMSPTPEVGTLLLIGSGLIAMRWIRRARPRFFRTPQPA